MTASGILRDPSFFFMKAAEILRNYSFFLKAASTLKITSLEGKKQMLNFLFRRV